MVFITVKFVVKSTWSHALIYETHDIDVKMIKMNVRIVNTSQGRFARKRKQCAFNLMQGRECIFGIWFKALKYMVDINALIIFEKA